MKKFALILLFVACFAKAGDWTQFRGPNGNGASNGKNLPTELTPKNLKWAKPLPGRGLSGVMVIGSKVIVTASSGPNQTRLHVVCLDAKDGRTLWHRQFWATGRTMCHPKTSVAAPTPCAPPRLLNP